MEKQERNKPYIAMQNENIVGIVEQGSTITIHDPDMGFEEIDAYDGRLYIVKPPFRTLFDGRYCAVSGFFFGFVNNQLCVLANKRGSGTPDFQGCWNCPCGYLERSENSIDGIIRETKEECGVDIPREKVQIVHVETEPAESNNGNVTIRHYGYLGKQAPIDKDIKLGEGGEENEVAGVKWIPLSDLDKYEWAFNHKKVIKELSEKQLMESCQKILKKNIR